MDEGKSERFKPGTRGGMNSTHGATFLSNQTSVFGTNKVEKDKMRILKKIIVISSIDKEIMKILTQIIEMGPRALTDDHDVDDPKDPSLHKAKIHKKGTKTELRENAERFLDQDKLNKLISLIDKVVETEEVTFETMLEIFKYYLVSPIEKNYVERIAEEISLGQDLDNQIQDANDRIKQEKEKKSKTRPVKESVGALLKEIEIYENKIEKANQQLNENMVQNQRLREKINQLRKDKIVIDQIYQKLEQELQEKQQSVEDTIRKAGDAYIQRNIAEEQLKKLKEDAEKQKANFEKEMKEINKNIQHDKRFKEFIKGKSKEKKELERLQNEISKNQKKIQEKEQSNYLMENEYKRSEKKEEEISNAFKRIKKETGIHQPKDLLTVFNNLHQKTVTLEAFVQDLNKEIEELDQKIGKVKEEIQNYNIRGASLDIKKKEDKTDITQKIEQEEKKKLQYKMQYEKLLETLNVLKGMIENTLVSIGANEEILNKIRNSALTEENMIEFIAILEEKGLNIIGEYSRLLAEQMKLDKDNQQNIPQLEDLNNIIAYENANMMNLYTNQPVHKSEVPDDLLQREKEKVNPEDESLKDIFSQEKFRQLAIEALNSANKKQNNNPKAGFTAMKKSTKPISKAKDV